MASNLVMPVNGSLKTALANANNQLDALAERRDRLNDNDDFHTTVGVLNALVMQLMSASDNNWLTVRQTVGARFDAGPDSHVHSAVDTVVGYLRDTVAPIKADPGYRYSSYTAKLTVEADAHLGSLYNSVVSSIAFFARQDLSAILKADPVTLVQTAEYLYGMAYPRPETVAKRGAVLNAMEEGTVA